MDTTTGDDGRTEQARQTERDFAAAVQGGHGDFARGLPRFVHALLDDGEEPAEVVERVAAAMLRDAAITSSLAGIHRRELAAETARAEAHTLVEREQRRSARRQQAEDERVEDEERAGARDDAASDAAAPGDDTRRLRLSPRLTRAEMALQTVQFLCPHARFLARGVASLITSLGGVGKTRLLLQMFYQLALGESLFDCELLRPERPMRCLYIGAEDRQPFFNHLALPLLTEDTDTLPFDVMLLPEVWPGFTLSTQTAPQLAAFCEAYRAEHGLDCVALDPMLSLIGMEHADMMRNPVIARGFFNECLAPLLASQAFALIGASHDSKTGAPVTGSADQQNAARFVLQLETNGPAPDGTTVITAGRHKDNLGFRFTTLALVRDPETLLLSWDEAKSVYAYGAPAGRLHTQTTTDPAGIRRYLCRQAARLLHPLAPPEQRIKGTVETLLHAEAQRDGVAASRDSYIRPLLNTFCAFEPWKQGRTTRLVLCGVRNPDAALTEHEDYIAGGPAPAVDQGAEEEGS